MSITEEGYKKAQAVLDACAKPTGFYASGLEGGYEATWARDSMITSLGASLQGNTYKMPFQSSIGLLSKNQSLLGQIPNAVGTYNIDRQSDVTYNSIDSSLWYLLGHIVFKEAYHDDSLYRKYEANVEKALTWLTYQDPNEIKLLAQLPTMDWQDAFPHKYGHTIHTQALYYAVLNKMGKSDEARHLQAVVNGEIEKYLSLYDPIREYYLPWIWKNHDGDREEEYWFDTLGNLLAIVSGLAPIKYSKRILKYIESENIAMPYPCKAIWPPIKKGDKEWHSYFSKCDASEPYAYLNAGIWPFIGGFYIAALVKSEEYKKAEDMLENLAHANKQGENRAWEFNEWLHGETGVSSGNPYQGWSAGMFAFAYECVKQKNVPYF